MIYAYINIKFFFISSIAFYYLFLARDELNQLMNNKVRKSLGLKNLWSYQSLYVFMSLLEDNMKPVVHQGILLIFKKKRSVWFNITWFSSITYYFSVEKLLNESLLKVYVLTGQLDFIINTPGMKNDIL